MKNLFFDKSWTIFLDRDGVINEKLENDYVKNWDEFVFTKNAKIAIANLSEIFGRIFVVTNQRGVGRGIMSEDQLIFIHSKMNDEVSSEFGRIDKIYYCTDIMDSSEYRKPNVGMALSAKKEFPDIDFSKSVMIGDSETDMIFGKNLGMKCFMISKQSLMTDLFFFDKKFESLFECAIFLKSEIIH